MERSPFAQAVGRLGPGLKFVLVALAVVGLLEALLVKWVGFGAAWSWLVVTPETVLHGQVWRLITAAFLTDIEHPMGLIFALVGLYFLSPDLETRWGTRRFLLFLAVCCVTGFLLAIGIDALASEKLALLHPGVLYGADAAFTGTAIAWGLYNRTQRVLLFMVLPVSGMALVWTTIVGCFLYLLYLGDVMSFGGVIIGFLFTGEPSLARRWYLQAKLALMRRRSGGRVPTAHEIAFGAAKKGKARGDRPPLRVVKGGQADVDDDKPKDKRYLN